MSAAKRGGRTPNSVKAVELLARAVERVLPMSYAHFWSERGDMVAGRRKTGVAMKVTDEVLDEIKRAIAKFPTWPTDPLHALAVLGEEFGELTKAMLQEVYEPEKNEPGAVRKEAIQTAAMAIRLLASLESYQYKQCDQHRQDVLS